MISVTLLICFSLAQVPTTPLNGTVIGPRGVLVGGAEVILVGSAAEGAGVLARAMTDEAGHFALARPASLAGGPLAKQIPTLFAIKAGFVFGSHRFEGPLPPEGEAVTLRLGPPGGEVVRVVRPDGTPAAGVRVVPVRIQEPYTELPDAVAQLAAARTGPDGVAMLELVVAGTLLGLDVDAAELGIQAKPIKQAPGKLIVVKLRPASSWSGQLKADDPALVRGWRVRAWTDYDHVEDGEPVASGFVETTSDAEGRFHLAPIAVGLLQFEFRPPGPVPVLVQYPRPHPRVEPREGEPLVIKLERASTLTGLVLEQGTDQPIAGVTVEMAPIGNTGGSTQTTRTDDRGRYTIRCLPGSARLSYRDFPASHIEVPGSPFEYGTVPPFPAQLEVPTRRAIASAPALAGRVVDAAGQPVADAGVFGEWLGPVNGNKTRGNARTRTDATGQFNLLGLAPGSEVALTASQGNRRSAWKVRVPAQPAEPVTLKILPKPAFALAGRVVDEAGNGVPDLTLRVQLQWTPTFGTGSRQALTFTGNPTLRTAADGTFRTPVEIDRTGGYFAVLVTGAGFIPTHTDLATAPIEDLFTFPPLTIKHWPAPPVPAPGG